MSKIYGKIKNDTFIYTEDNDSVIIPQVSDECIIPKIRVYDAKNDGSYFYREIGFTNKKFNEE